MTNRGKYKQYRFENDLDRGAGHDYDNDPDFDLDEYIRQQSRGEHDYTAPVISHEEDDTSQFKNAVLFFLVFAAAFLWVNDWSPTQAWNSVFGSDEAATEVTADAPGFTFTVPDIPDIPDIPAAPEVMPVPNTATSSGFIDYMKEINEGGLGDLFPNQAYIAFYQSDIPAEFISEVNESGYLEQLSFTDLIIFHENGGDIEYLDAMKEANYMEDLSIRSVLILQSAEVPVEFIKTLDENGLLEGMSYTEIIMAYKADN